MNKEYWEVTLKGTRRYIYVEATNANQAIELAVERHNKGMKVEGHINSDIITSAQRTDKVPYESIINMLPRAKYTIDVDWDSIEYILEGYKKNYQLELEPDFQRAHVWSEEQQQSYIEYAMRGGVSGKEIFFNAPEWRCGSPHSMVLVDGLQRLTAIRKFLCGELTILGKYTVNSFQRLDLMTCTMKFSINDLGTRKEVLSWYLDFNSAGTQHTQEELDKVRKLIIEKE